VVRRLPAAENKNGDCDGKRCCDPENRRDRLREAGLAAGDEVVVRSSGQGRIEIERANDLVRRYAGSLPAGTYPPGYLNGLRGEWGE
jgi:hypothetical protein